MSQPCCLHLRRVTGLVVGAGLLAMLLACGGRMKRNRSAGSLIGKPAPRLQGKDLDGKDVRLSDYRGKVVVLDIWADWCPHCQDMMDHKRQLVKRLAGKPFVLVSVNDDDEKETLVAAMKREPMPWVNWWAGEGGVDIDDWKIEGYPTVHVLDHNGIIRYTGARDDKLDRAVDKLLAELAVDRGK